MVEVYKHFDACHEEDPVELRRDGLVAPVEREEPLRGHVHCLQDGHRVELECLAKRDLDHRVQQAWVRQE